MTCVTGDTHPGKFEASGPIGEKLYEMSLDFLDDQSGSVYEGGWHGLLIDTGLKCAPNAIISEDSQGFVEYEAYRSRKAAWAAFAELSGENDDDSV